jgi:site-specific DNA recombinase
MGITKEYVIDVEDSVGVSIVHVAIYARLSKDLDGLSTNTAIQVSECLDGVARYAAVRGVRADVAAIFEENDVGASEYSKKQRPGFRELVELIKENKVDVIFATEVERLVRRPGEAEMLIDLTYATNLKEIQLTSSESYDLSTSVGIQRLRNAVNLAERESRKTSERLRRKQAYRARAGLSHGSRRCFGYKSGNNQIDEYEAAVLREMGSKLLAGCSFKEIAYWANEQGYKTAEGKLWYAVTIRNSLRRVRYAGIREHRGAYYPAMWPAIFDATTWERMQSKIRASADRYAGQRKPRRYLLTGLVHCGKCGTPLNGELKRDNPNRPVRPIYYCRVQGNAERERGCGGVAINADALNWYIRECVFDRLIPGDVPVLMRAHDSVGQKLEQLFETRAAQQSRLDELVDDYAAGFLSRHEFARAREKAQAELSRINSEIHLSGDPNPPVEEIGPRGSLTQAWNNHEDTRWRRSLIDAAVERIEVYPGLRKPYVDVDGVKMRFDKERVKITWRKREDGKR